MRLELLHDRETMYPVTSMELDYILGFAHPMIDGDCIPSFISGICEEFLEGVYTIRGSTGHE